MGIIRISQKTEEKLNELSIKNHNMTYENISKDFLINSLISELEKSHKTI